jgi:nitroimidazol reductase NimA-like FMN-containing flavoprotein (pyridoxamine 5'-phosphate oxidase superfamily)
VRSGSHCRAPRTLTSVTQYEPTERTQVRRKPSRGSYDRDLIHSILDEAMICHVGFAVDGQPYVIPTIHARAGERIYLHGSPRNRAFGELAEGTPCCVTASLVDGVVLARSATQHSLNYRSAMILGTGRRITEPDEKTEALRAVVEHVVPGRWDEVRAPSADELETTQVIAVEIEEASAKVRSGPPIDKREDVDPTKWAGVLPLEVRALAPLSAADLAPGTAVPAHVAKWRRGE